MGFNCSQYRAKKGKSVTETRTHAPTHPLTQPHKNGRIPISPQLLLRGDNKSYCLLEFTRILGLKTASVILRYAESIDT